MAPPSLPHRAPSSWADRAWQSRALRRIRARLARPHPAPVLVLGNQKSGTTAIAALLAQAAGRSAALDLRDEMRAPILPDLYAGAITARQVVRRYGIEFSRGVVKEPGLSLVFEPILAALPSARAVMIFRDPRDNLRSILDRHGFRGDLARLTPAEWEGLNPGWRTVFDGAWLGIRSEHPIEVLAARWQRIADLYGAAPQRLAMIRYEDFVSDKLGRIENLADRLGLPVCRDISGSVDHPFQAPGRRDVDLRAFFGADGLERIETVCARGMDALGYKPLD